jgi:hypothetical protein
MRNSPTNRELPYSSPCRLHFDRTSNLAYERAHWQHWCASLDHRTGAGSKFFTRTEEVCQWGHSDEGAPLILSVLSGCRTWFCPQGETWMIRKNCLRWFVQRELKSLGCENGCMEKASGDSQSSGTCQGIFSGSSFLPRLSNEINHKNANIWCCLVRLLVISHNLTSCTRMILCRRTVLEVWEKKGGIIRKFEPWRTCGIPAYPVTINSGLKAGFWIAGLTTASPLASSPLLWLFCRP